MHQLGLADRLQRAAQLRQPALGRLGLARAGEALNQPLQALHRLLRPLTRLRGTLPEPQAQALRVAFGEEEGAAVEPFLVGVATLSLLTSAAEENPVLCVVDDAHWLDAATAAALLFCARRLGADRVALVFAARDEGTFDPQGVAELTLTVGKSHPEIFTLPKGIKAEVDKQTILKLSGVDKELLGQTAAKIRSFRKPEPYKGKGVKYIEETIRRKAGKAAK